MLALDQLALNGQVASDWPSALRAIDPSIDRKIDRCLANVSNAGPYTPKPDWVWRAFRMSPKSVRVLIVGQDPYPDPALATGIAFSTGPNGPISDSLKNIYGELRGAVGRLPNDGDLTPWTNQGVFLLNRALTVHRVRRVPLGFTFAGGHQCCGQRWR